MEDAVYIESVAEGDSAAIAAQIQQLLDQGCTLIFTTSFEFMNPTKAMADAHPDRVFMHCSGYVTAPNMGIYFARIYQADYLTGLIAGEMTQTDTLGYVAPVRIPEVYRGINAFTIGVRERNPDAVVVVRWVGAWFDPATSTLKTQELLSLGADLIASGQDSPAPVQAAEQAGVVAFGYK